MEGGNKNSEHDSGSTTTTSATTIIDRPFNNPMPHVIPTGENAAPLSVIGCTATEKVIIIMVGVSFEIPAKMQVIHVVFQIISPSLSWMVNSSLPQERRMSPREYADT